MVRIMEPLDGPTVLHLNFLCGAEQTLDLSDETIVSVRYGCSATRPMVQCYFPHHTYPSNGPIFTTMLAYGQKG